MVAYRYLRGRVDGLVIQMEKESIKLVQAIDRAGATRPLAAQSERNAPRQLGLAQHAVQLDDLDRVHRNDRRAV